MQKRLRNKMTINFQNLNFLNFLSPVGKSDKSKPKSNQNKIRKAVIQKSSLSKFKELWYAVDKMNGAWCYPTKPFRVKECWVGDKPIYNRKHKWYDRFFYRWTLKQIRGKSNGKV